MYWLFWSLIDKWSGAFPGELFADLILSLSLSILFQYARETDQLNKINRNECRQKILSLDPETQVGSQSILLKSYYCVCCRVTFFTVCWVMLNQANMILFSLSRDWTSQALSQMWSPMRNASDAVSWSAAMTWPLAFRAVSVKKMMEFWPM